MRLSTSRFGEINYNSNEIITLNEGLFGLENYTRYLILRPLESKPFLWLQSLDNPSIALPVIPADFLIPDYQIELSPELKVELQADKNVKLEIYCIVYLEVKPQDTTVNLLTPVIINPAKGLARQVTVEKEPHTSRHNLFEFLAKAKSTGQNS
jgi:flagellar assembly factor FliW